MLRYYLSTSLSAVVVFVVALLLLSGCGGSEDDSVTVTTGSLSKAVFIQRADGLCKGDRSKFDREFAARSQEGTPKLNQPAQEAFITEAVETSFLPIYEEMVEQISALGAPAGDEQKISRFLTALQQRLDVIQDDPFAASRTPTPFLKAEKLAAAYGLQGCAESFS